MGEWIVNLWAVPLETSNISEARLAQLKNELGLSPRDCLGHDDPRLDKLLIQHPTTSKTGAISVIDIENFQGQVFICRPDVKPPSNLNRAFSIVTGSERDALNWFFDLRIERMVGFKLRTFIAPFISTRAIANSVKHTIPLNTYRYAFERQVDLGEVLSHYNAMSTYFLEDYCLALGVKINDAPFNSEAFLKSWAIFPALPGKEAGIEPNNDQEALVEIGSRCADTSLATSFLYLKIRESFAGVIKGL